MNASGLIDNRQAIFIDGSRAARNVKEEAMPIYDIHYLDHQGGLTHSFSAACENDTRAKVLAHAMKSPDCRQFEIWFEGYLVYRRPYREAKG